MVFLGNMPGMPGEVHALWVLLELLKCTQNSIKVELSSLQERLLLYKQLEY